MTKLELEEKIKGLEEENSQLKNDVDYQIKEFNDLEDIKEELECEIADLEMKGGISDPENFIFKLKLDGLYSDALKKFIDNYLKYEEQNE